MSSRLPFLERCYAVRLAAELAKDVEKRMTLDEIAKAALDDEAALDRAIEADRARRRDACT